MDEVRLGYVWLCEIAFIAIHMLPLSTKREHLKLNVQTLPACAKHHPGTKSRSDMEGK